MISVLDVIPRTKLTLCPSIEARPEALPVIIDLDWSGKTLTLPNGGVVHFNQFTLSTVKDAEVVL